jgi:hypothetical protein
MLYVKLNSFTYLIVVRLTITALEELLANKVNSVRTAAEVARL